MTTEPTPPIAFPGGSAAVTSRLGGPVAEIPETVLARLAATCPTSTEPAVVAEASRDWWLLGLHWALADRVGQLAGVVCRPTDAGQVAGVLRTCHEAKVPVTPAAGRSGVCGATVPVHGGVLLDLTGLQGITGVDDPSLTVDVQAGTFGTDLEDDLCRDHGLTLGHWPQSIAISTVGGWLACRSSGQYSTRYGKIEDMVVGLDVVLADGTQLTTGGAPRAATGPDLTQLFVGSEGTLGVITGARLRVHPVAPHTASAAYGFPTFAEGLDACRRVLRRGATPAVLRLYDEAEAARSHHTDGSVAVLLVLDEGDQAIVEAVMAIVADECRAAATLDAGLVEGWLAHRNDVSALPALTEKGFVLDTMEIAAPWRDLASIYEHTRVALLGVPDALVATAHLSHAYPDGACLYFTFAARPEPEQAEATYVALWDAGQRAALSAGANLSHHHGIGLNRARFAAEALGPAHRLLVELKQALDPHGILNPGKLGLPSPFGQVAWP